MITESEVYVVDDDVGIRDSLRFLLEAHGISTLAFGSAKDFLAAGSSTKNGCLIADVRMPDMTGLQLQEELLRRNSSLAVIIVTGHADVPMAVTAMRAGAIDFLEKPFSDEALLTTVQRALARPAGAARERVNSGSVDVYGARLARLTPREREVVEHLVLGNPHKVIAHALGISPRTIEVHRARIMRKLEVANLADLVRLRLGR